MNACGKHVEKLKNSHVMHATIGKGRETLAVRIAKSQATKTVTKTRTNSFLNDIPELIARRQARARSRASLGQRANKRWLPQSVVTDAMANASNARMGATQYRETNQSRSHLANLNAVGCTRRQRQHTECRSGESARFHSN